MRSIVALSFSLVWISACVGCGTLPSPKLAHRALVDRLEDETVALVAPTDEDGHLGVYCSGVWVSPTSFLTAGHCAESLTRSPADDVLEALGLEVDHDPTGVEVLFSERADIEKSGRAAFWRGHVVKWDHNRDLALVQANITMPPHAFARVSQAAIEPGDRVEWVGHPVMHVWSYAEGYISAVRPEEPNGDHVPMPTLQIAGPVSPGNSGCGAFDDAGDLIGIGSYIESHTNGMGFFVSRSAISAFLKS